MANVVAANPSTQILATYGAGTWTEAGTTRTINWDTVNALVPQLFWVRRYRRNVPIAPYEYVAPYIEKVQKGLTLPVMQELNARVDIDKQEPAAVATEYLKEDGYIQ